MIMDAVVKASGAALPKLHFVWDKYIASPIVRHGHGLIFEHLLIVTLRGVERFPAGDLGGLSANPCADLACSGASRKISFAFFSGERKYRTNRADLPL